MQAFSPMAGGVNVAATASSVSGTITMPAIANALYVANSSATLHVGVATGAGSAPTAALTSMLIPPMGSVLIEVPQGLITHVAAIGSAAGPTTVNFTPAYVQR
jgi:hypothetical protein